MKAARVGDVVWVRRRDNGCLFMVLVVGIGRGGRLRGRWEVRAKGRQGTLTRPTLLNPDHYTIEMHATDQDAERLREIAAAEQAAGGAA